MSCYLQLVHDQSPLLEAFVCFFFHSQHMEPWQRCISELNVFFTRSLKYLKLMFRPFLSVNFVLVNQLVLFSIEGAERQTKSQESWLAIADFVEQWR